MSVTPPLIEDSGGDPPAPYTLTDGVQGPTQTFTDRPETLILGKAPPSGLHKDSPWNGTQTQSSGLPWYGSHLSVGKRP